MSDDLSSKSLRAATFRTLAGVWLALFVLVASIMFFSTGGFRFYRLMGSGVRTTAAVTEADCANHRKFKYEFQVDGVVHRGVGVEHVGIDCSALKPGDPVTVFYAAGDPDRNANTEPAGAFRGELTLDLMSAAVASSLLVFRLALHRNRNRG